MFGIGLVDWVMRNQAGLLEDALAARPALLSVSFGTDWSWVSAAHDAGITTVTQIYDGLGARQAVDAGIDIVVARGSEEAATETRDSPHCRCWTPSWMRCRCRCSPAAGSPRPAASPPCWPPGPAGMGRYRLAACPEALTGEGSRRALIAAAATDTVITRIFDVAKGLPWPARFPSRVLANDFVARWTGNEDELAVDRRARDELAGSIAADDRRIAPVTAGQAVGMVSDDASVGEVIEQMCAGAEKLLAGWGP